jgi:hypothetical protein
VTVLPLTLQALGGVAEKVTARPDDAVAATVRGDALRETSGSGAKVIVCVFLLIAKICVTGDAAEYVALPG